MKGLATALAVLSGILIISAVTILLSTPQPPSLFPGSSAEAFGIPGVSAQGYQYIYQQDKDTLTVTGSATLSSTPNKVDVYLGVETEKPTALESQQTNAQLMQAVRNAITGVGIPADAIKTTSFRLSVVRNYQPKPPQIVGYKTTHLLKIPSSDIAQAGQIIDAATSAGANVISNVAFGLTSDIQKQLKAQALKSAAENAREKAESIASGLGVSIVKVVQASEGSVGITPVFRGFEAAAEQAPTEITPGDVDVSAVVTVVYEIS